MSSTPVKDRGQGSCQVLVAINDVTTIDVINNVIDHRSPDNTNSGATADAFAAIVVRNLASAS